MLRGKESAHRQGAATIQRWQEGSRSVAAERATCSCAAGGWSTRAPWVSEEDEYVALVLHLLQPPVPFGVDDLDDLDRVFSTRAAQRAEAHLAKGTLTQLVLDVKVARFQDPLAGLGGGSGWKFGSRAGGSVRHAARLTAVNARAQRGGTTELSENPRIHASVVSAK